MSRSTRFLPPVTRRSATTGRPVTGVFPITKMTNGHIEATRTTNGDDASADFRLEGTVTYRMPRWNRILRRDRHGAIDQLSCHQSPDVLTSTTFLFSMSALFAFSSREEGLRKPFADPSRDRSSRSCSVPRKSPREARRRHRRPFRSRAPSEFHVLDPG